MMWPTFADVRGLAEFAGWIFLGSSLILIPAMGRKDADRHRAAWYCVLTVWTPLLVAAVTYGFPMFMLLVGVVVIPVCVVATPVVWCLDRRERRKRQRTL